MFVELLFFVCLSDRNTVKIELLGIIGYVYILLSSLHFSFTTSGLGVLSRQQKTHTEIEGTYVHMYSLIIATIINLRNYTTRYGGVELAGFTILPS